MNGFDIASRLPINKTAFLVVGKGEHYECPKKIVEVYSEMPLKTKAPIKAALQNKSFVDLRGQRRGRLLIIGLSHDFKGKWVVRCDCGAYSLRNSKALKNDDNNDMCAHCQHLEFLKKKDHFLRYNKYNDINN